MIMTLDIPDTTAHKLDRLVFLSKLLQNAPAPLTEAQRAEAREIGNSKGMRAANTFLKEQQIKKVASRVSRLSIMRALVELPAVQAYLDAEIEKLEKAEAAAKSPRARSSRSFVTPSVS